MFQAVFRYLDRPHLGLLSPSLSLDIFHNFIHARTHEVKINHNYIVMTTLISTKSNRNYIAVINLTLAKGKIVDYSHYYNLSSLVHGIGLCAVVYGVRSHIFIIININNSLLILFSYGSAVKYYVANYTIRKLENCIRATIKI